MAWFGVAGFAGVDEFPGTACPEAACCMEGAGLAGAAGVGAFAGTGRAPAAVPGVLDGSKR